MQAQVIEFLMTAAKRPKLDARYEGSMKVGLKQNKTFLSWVSKGDEQYQVLVKYALENLLPIFENDGFEWVEKNLEGFKTPFHMIDLERRGGKYAERVTIIFDKHRRKNLILLCA